MAAAMLGGVNSGAAFAKKEAQVVNKTLKGKCYGMVIDLRRCTGVTVAVVESST
ncbi:MAG: hypothetical protein JSV82_00795 [Planctomycetota bacterium]|nr:MAG: hypothetical protein JSV82_00795 [Planctomycetota bacterium]